MTLIVLKTSHSISSWNIKYPTKYRKNKISNHVMVQSPIITSFKVVNNTTAPIMVPWGRLNFSREMDGPFETENFGENPKFGQSVELERKM